MAPFFNKVDFFFFSILSLRRPSEDKIHSLNIHAQYVLWGWVRSKMRGGGRPDWMCNQTGIVDKYLWDPAVLDPDLLSIRPISPQHNRGGGSSDKIEVNGGVHL